MRVCAVHGCPTLIEAGTRCTTHARQADRRRGTRQQRGYGAEHLKLRAQWAPKVATGTVTCWRCGEPITATEAWDLGHHDSDRTQYQGPEHAYRCNRSAAGRKSHPPPS